MSSPPSFAKLLALYAVAGATILVVGIIGVFFLPSHGESDAAFYSIVLVAVIAGTAAWSWAETFLSTPENRSAIELPFMVQSSLSPVWAVAAGATIMFSASATRTKTESPSSVVTERQIDFSESAAWASIVSEESESTESEVGLP